MVYATCYVQVPTFINPHLFWLFDVEREDERSALQSTLKDRLKRPKKITALQGELVVVLDGKKWKRAEIKKAFGVDFDCWLIDYGLLHKASDAYELPSDLKALPPMVRAACLNDVVELSEKLEVCSENRGYEETVGFSPGLCRIVNSYISNAEAIVFQTERVFDNVLCGQLVLVRNKVSRNLIQMLLEENRIVINKPIFREAFKANHHEVDILTHANKILATPEKVIDAVEQIVEGIGRGYNRKEKMSEPTRTNRSSNSVEKWVKDSNKFLKNSNFERLKKADPNVARETENATIKIQDSLDSDAPFEDADGHTVHVSHSKLDQSFNSIDDDYFDNISERKQKITDLAKGRPSPFKAGAKLDRSSTSVDDDCFKIVRKEISCDSPSLRHNLALNCPFQVDTVSDDYFEPMPDASDVNEVSLRPKCNLGFAQNNVSKESDRSVTRNRSSNIPKVDTNSLCDIANVVAAERCNVNSLHTRFNVNASNDDYFESLQGNVRHRNDASTVTQDSHQDEGLNIRVNKGNSCPKRAQRNNAFDDRADKKLGSSNCLPHSVHSKVHNTPGKSYRKPDTGAGFNRDDDADSFFDLKEDDTNVKAKVCIDMSKENYQIVNSNDKSVNRGKVCDKPKIVKQDDSLDDSGVESAKLERTSVNRKVECRHPEDVVRLQTKNEGSTHCSSTKSELCKDSGNNADFQESDQNSLESSTPLTTLKGANSKGKNNRIPEVEFDHNITETIQHKKSESPKDERSSPVPSKLPGLQLYPAGYSFALSRQRASKLSPKSEKKFTNCNNRNDEELTRTLDRSESSTVSSDGPSNESSKSVSNVPSLQAGNLSQSCESDSDSGGAPPREEHLMTLGCKCEKCQMWNVSDIAGECNEYKDTKSAGRRTIAKPSPLFKPKNSVEFVEIKTKKFRGCIPTKIERDMVPTLLVHGYCVPAPANRITDVPFHADVHRALTNLKFRSTKSIQSYAWPAVMRQMNVCMVHGHGSGKTMSYLPAICSYVLERHERYPDLPNDKSPIAIVLCEGAQKAEEIFDLFCNFRARTGNKFKICWAAPPIDANCLRNFNTSCDILVATPLSLIKLLKRHVITLKRLCHLVLEEADGILNKFEPEFNSITEVVQSMLEHRSCMYSVQVVACSEHWTVQLERFLKRMYSVPLVCIGSYLEAAFYGRADIQMHFLQTKIKLATLCDILKEMSHIYKTVVVCNDETEIKAAEDYLRVQGVSVTSVYSSMMREEVNEVELLWENTVSGKHAALICTDSLLHSQLSITGATLLVHYSLPSESWTLFSRRFKCLVDSYSSPFSAKDSGSCRVHIFADQTCVKQFPRLYNFLETMGAKLSQKFLESCEKINRNEELRKQEAKVKLCGELKLFGKCRRVRCEKRHVPSEDDFSGTLPQNGFIKFKVSTVNDVAVYTVSLLEHTDARGKVHNLPDNAEIVGAQLAEAVQKQKVFARCPTVGELYAWFDDEDNSYHRCEILKVLSECDITKTANKVIIKLIDTGRLRNTANVCLFELSEYYKKFPAQGIEVYLANVLPPDSDSAWSCSMRRKVEDIFIAADYKSPTAYFSGRILLQVGNTLWLDDVRLSEDLTFASETVTRLMVKKALLERHLVSHKEEQLQRLYDLCKSAGINLPNYECPSPVRALPCKIVQVTPQWAHFDEDNLNAVYFCNGVSPHEFYVRIQKFDSLFQKMQKELQQVLTRPHYPVVTDVLIGNCYLVKDPGSEDYCRAVVTGIDDEMISCFFVDYGDATCVLKSELKHLADNYITKLPFQVIQCKLFGTSPPMESWPDAATDVLYQYCFEPKTDDCDTQSDIYRPLYVSSVNLMQSTTLGLRKYSVLLVDYYSKKPVVINKILIDCGFAVNAEDVSLENISLPECPECDDNDDDFLDLHDADEKKETFDEIEKIKERYSNEDDCELIETIAQSRASCSRSDNVWDIEVGDAEAFLKDFVEVNKINTKTNSSPKKEKSELSETSYPMKPLPPAKHLTPDVLWYQTDKCVKIDIKLPNIIEYTLQVIRRKIFNFNTTTTGGKNYKLNFQLYDLVDKTVQHSAGGLVVRVTLQKSNPIDWPRLTLSEDRVWYIKYDVSKWSFPEEKKRLFLEMDKVEDGEDEQADGHYLFESSGEDFDESDLESDTS